MESLRIAHVMGEFRPDRGGQSRMVGSLATALVGRGHTIDVFAFGPTAPLDGVGVHGVSAGDVYSGRFWKRLREGRFEVVHTHGYSSLAPAKALPAELTQGAARVFTPHFHEVGSYPLALRRLYDMTLGAAVARSAHQIQVDTAVERDVFAKLHGVPQGRFEVIPPSLAASFADRLTPTRAPPPKEDFRILFVGRLSPPKGVDVLLRALALLRDRDGIRLPLTVVGRDEGGELNRLQAIVADLHLDGVEFRGAVGDDELVDLYDLAGVLALPSRAEAFGIVLLEAMSRGLPVIAARSGGMPALVEHGRNGLLADYGDSDALAKAIGQLALDASLWSGISSAGPITAKGYRPSEIAARTDAAYRRALAPS